MTIELGQIYILKPDLVNLEYPLRGFIAGVKTNFVEFASLDVHRGWMNLHITEILERYVLEEEPKIETVYRIGKACFKQVGNKLELI